MPFLLLLLLFCYPGLAHLSIYLGHPAWAAYLLATVFALIYPYTLIRNKQSIWQISLSILSSLFVIWMANSYAKNLLFAQPIILNSLICMVFLSTLFGKSEPLIGRFATVIRHKVADNVLVYCRWVTWAWAIFFFLLAIASAVLAAKASIEVWSWFSNVVAFILIGIMFILEFAVRKIVLKSHVTYSFYQFMGEMRQVDYRQIARGLW